MLDGGIAGPLSDVHDKFKEIDKNHDGKISVDELCNYLEKHNDHAHEAAYKQAFVALYMIANPKSREADINKMTFTEEQTAGLLYYLPSYRSAHLAARDPFFEAQSKDTTRTTHNTDTTDTTKEPLMTFDSITHGAKTMTYQDFAAAAKEHEKFKSQEQASLLINKAQSGPDCKQKGVEKEDVSKDGRGTIDFGQFKSIYNIKLFPD